MLLTMEPSGRLLLSPSRGAASRKAEQQSRNCSPEEAVSFFFFEWCVSWVGRSLWGRLLSFCLVGLLCLIWFIVFDLVCWFVDLLFCLVCWLVWFVWFVGLIWFSLVWFV